MGSVKETQKRSIRNNYFLKAFFLGLGLSFLVFIPFLLVDGGRFLFYGDFNVQQVPFYRLAHDAVRSGNLGWSHLTDLGANFVGSYSFYLLGSPFFWLTIPFPSDWVQYLMGPLLQKPGFRPDCRGAVRVLWLLGVQYLFQPLPRGHCVLPPAAGGAG